MSSNPNAPLISVKGLSKSYEVYSRASDRLLQMLFGNDDKRYFKHFTALSDVTFEVTRGSSFAVIGKNGAGKSTLLQLITGTLQPTTGTIKVNGKVAAVLELGAGFNPEFSGRENIELYCNLFLMSPELIRSRFDQIVEFSELRDFIDQPLKTYSSGMVARLAFSVIAHVDADILIIDEALSVGDAAFSQKCMRYLRDFKRRGSIFFVSHDLSAVKSFCDDAIWLENGKVKAIGEASRVCDAYLAEIYPNDTFKKEATASRPTEGTTRLRVSRKLVPPKSDTKEAVDRGAMRMEGFNFNAQSSQFGNGNARILSVQMTDGEGHAVTDCEGQRQVFVTVEVQAVAPILSPIVGFHVKDRLGQPLFGGNTFKTYEGNTPQIEAGQVFEALFSFRMPTLMVGDYSITAAIADGTLETHTQLHWLHDAALFSVTASSLDGVLVGIPIDGIELRL